MGLSQNVLSCIRIGVTTKEANFIFKSGSTVIAHVSSFTITALMAELTAAIAGKRGWP